MIRLTRFESCVIRKTCESAMSEGLLSISGDLLDQILDKGAEDCDYNGYGYYLTIRHGGLPQERHFLKGPEFLGRWNGIESGFTVIIEDRELVLECFPYGGVIPPDYRDRPVEIYEIEYEIETEDGGVGGKPKPGRLD